MYSTATIGAVAPNLLVTFLLERDICGQASILHGTGTRTNGGDPVESSNERLRNDSPPCRGMTKIMRIMKGEAGVVGYDEEKGVLCHTEQILEL